MLFWVFFFPLDCPYFCVYQSEGTSQLLGVVLSCLKCTLVITENLGLDTELVLLMQKSSHFLCRSANIMCVHKDPLGLSVVGITLILLKCSLDSAGDRDLLIKQI